MYISHCKRTQGHTTSGKRGRLFGIFTNVMRHLAYKTLLSRTPPLALPSANMKVKRPTTRRVKLPLETQTKIIEEGSDACWRKQNST
ncbi:hypothetical protein E6H15_00575 [Candidatus Bathyarchaeota archaeon]|nr:MAG: hypothetical protein E6H15_00575 [Candidatus Bathyarchaeota archaeon]